MEEDVAAMGSWPRETGNENSLSLGEPREDLEEIRASRDRNNTLNLAPWMAVW